MVDFTIIAFAIFMAVKFINSLKKKEVAVKYIRLYNEKHPVYFPKG